IREVGAINRGTSRNMLIAQFNYCFVIVLILCEVLAWLICINDRHLFCYRSTPVILRLCFQVRRWAEISTHPTITFIVLLELRRFVRKDRRALYMLCCAFGSKLLAAYPLYIDMQRERLLRLFYALEQSIVMTNGWINIILC
ncbi:hypothetical protein PENTCL1PPCAC_4015, partial [Pristionchus entomophagus]